MEISNFAYCILFDMFGIEYLLKNKSARRSIRLSHPLNGVFVCLDEHNGDSRYLPNPPLQVLITGGHNIDPILNPFNFLPA